MSDGVRRLLITAAEDSFWDFDVAVGWYVNPIERRGQTVFCTCMDEDYNLVLEVAKGCGVTVQEKSGNDWPVVVQGPMEAWKP